MKNKILLWSFAVTSIISQAFAQGGRIEVSLDGQWAVEEGIEAEHIPVSFTHTAPVPGLTHQAEPAFSEVDQFESFTYLKLMVRRGFLPASELSDGMGRTRQKRNYFWYGKAFTAPAPRGSAILVINKAQFGTAVWLNGKKIGEQPHCFTPGRFDLRSAINWGGENRLIIRIGAHPGVMPTSVLWGNDAEKAAWTPGIYDKVSAIFADNPAIESVQIAPRIAESAIVIQTKLKNLGPACIAQLVQQVATWKGHEPVGSPVRLEVSLAEGEEKTLTQTIPVPNATLWTPENPFLYIVETDSGGDNCTTRFGMREFRFDTATRLAYLNGKICYWRGSSITLHRFFADPLSKGHPWDEAWVRKFLVEIPRQMHWNAFRLSIGPVPQQWLDIADETGIMLQYEFPIWPSSQGAYLTKLWSEADLTLQLKEFMQDNWNHPSVVLWDASNEAGLTGDGFGSDWKRVRWDFLADRLIPAVRDLDLSHRPWENSDCPPSDPNDPFEVHIYSMSSPRFRLTDLEDGPRPGVGSSLRSAHAALLNEYEWLWLRRDGTPTLLSKDAYQRMGLTGDAVTADRRFEEYAYILAGETEHFRAFRTFAGVMYLAYLDGDLPTSSTCDNFLDPEKLELEPHFADYMKEASKPLGVYLSFWQPTLAPGFTRNYQVMLVNDTQETARGRLELSWQGEDGKATSLCVQKAFVVPPVGQMTYEPSLTAPKEPGNYVLVARAYWDGHPWSPTVSRRKVQLATPTNAK